MKIILGLILYFILSFVFGVFIGKICSTNSNKEDEEDEKDYLDDCYSLRFGNIKKGVKK